MARQASSNCSNWAPPAGDGVFHRLPVGQGGRYGWRREQGFRRRQSCRVGGYAGFAVAGRCFCWSEGRGLVATYRPLLLARPGVNSQAQGRRASKHGSLTGRAAQPEAPAERGETVDHALQARPDGDRGH